MNSKVHYTSNDILNQNMPRDYAKTTKEKTRHLQICYLKLLFEVVQIVFMWAVIVWGVEVGCHAAVVGDFSFDNLI